MLKLKKWNFRKPVRIKKLSTIELLNFLSKNFIKKAGLIKAKLSRPSWLKFPRINWESPKIPDWIKSIKKVLLWNGSSVVPESAKRIWRYLVTHREATVLTLLLVISAIAHGYNMYNYPYFENDEGTYLARGWAVQAFGQLDIYTYYYDHVPGVSFLVAIWSSLTGGLLTFGESVKSGRVLMLVIHLIEVWLIMYTSKRITKSIIPGAIAVTFMSLSPLSIYFQRRVLLDNVMTMWLMVTTAILLKDNLRLKDIYWSAFTFALAVLSKENAILLLPIYIIYIWFRAHKESRIFAGLNWLFIAGGFISMYALYALIKGELIPVEWLPELLKPEGERVSLLGTLKYHLGRGNGLPFYVPGSDFYEAARSWFGKDPFLIYTSFATTIVGTLLSIFYKPARLVVWILAINWWYLMRGSFVIDFYILPMIPYLGLLFGIIYYKFLGVMKLNSNSIKFLTTASVFLILGVVFYSQSYKIYNGNETKTYIDSLKWAKENIPSDSVIAIDTALVVDMQMPDKDNNIAFPDAHPAWKIEQDPEIQHLKLDNDWRNIDYVLLTHETVKQIKGGEFPLLDRYLDSAILLEEWYSPNSETYLNVGQRVSTNGDWVQAYKLPSPEQLILRDTWETYKKNFIVSYGQVIDPQSNDRTTSEGQSYAMLRAAILEDKTTFDSIWTWTQDNLRSRGIDSLISWLWEKDDKGIYRQTDYETAADADLDIALSLLLAYEKWGEAEYLEDAKELINDIWEHQLVTINGQYYLTFNTSAERPEGYILNPSYFSPAHYRVFAKYDSAHNWNKVADDTYNQLTRLQSFQNNVTKLPPNWVIVNRQGQFLSARGYFPGNADLYGFDAFRTMWRVALDAKWFGTPQAYNYLTSVQEFYLENGADEGNFKAIYNLQGEPQVVYPTLSTDSGFLSLASVVNRPAANKYYDEYLVKVYDYNGGFWRDEKNYYDQNWVWFSMAIYLNEFNYPLD